MQHFFHRWITFLTIFSDMFGHGQKEWALAMIHTLVSHIPILKVFLQRGKTNPTISSHLLFQKITLFGKYVLKNADQRIIWIGLIVNNRYHGLLLTLTRTLSIKRTKSYFIRFNKVILINQSTSLISDRFLVAILVPRCCFFQQNRSIYRSTYYSLGT